MHTYSTVTAYLGEYCPIGMSIHMAVHMAIDRCMIAVDHVFFPTSSLHGLDNRCRKGGEDIWLGTPEGGCDDDVQWV